MSGVGTPRHEPVPIGEVTEPPFARPPDPATLFQTRADRLRRLSEGHALSPYLCFLAALSEAQHRAQDGLEAPDMPAEDVLERSRKSGMPPLDRSAFTLDAAFASTLARVLSLVDDIDMPAPARSALARAGAVDPEGREQMVRAVLVDAIPVESLADHLFVAAALQVHFSRRASRLDVKRLVPVGEGACPACGAPPVASMVVGWAGAHNARFCACSLCSTFWNVVRIKCALCGSTAKIGYQQIAGSDGELLAETCDNCHCYVKVLQQVQNPWLDPVADDVASLALDLMLRDKGYRRGAVNPFLLGY